MSPDARHDVQALLNVLPLPSYVYNLETRLILGANEAFCSLLGYTLEQLQSKPVLELYPPEDRDEVSEAIRHAGNEGVGERRFYTSQQQVVTVRVRYRNSEFMTQTREFVLTRLVVVVSEDVPAPDAH